MKKETFYSLLNNIDDSYIHEAAPISKKMIPFRHLKPIFAAAACLCIVLATLFAFNRSTPAPHPEQVQIANPLMEVGSLSDMERYLDFNVPVLKKDVEAYIVFVSDCYPISGRIVYADGSIFNMEYGTGDISGIYGGKLEKTETIAHAVVRFFAYTDFNGVLLSYATWEKNGFTYSLSEENTSFEQLAQDIQTLMK